MRASAAGPRPNWFIGLPLPASAGWQIAAGSLPLPLRPLAPQDLHVTVAFLGPCGEERARQAWQAAAALGHPPIGIGAGAWRGFGRRRAPSAFGLTLAEGHAQLAELIRRWRDPILRAAGRAPEERDPLPHITMARPPRRSGAAERARILRLLLDQPLPGGRVDLATLALFTWAEDPRGSRFRMVERRPLDRPLAGGLPAQDGQDAAEARTP